MSDRGAPPTDTDAAKVAEFGYQQELRREFGFFHAFAISFADTSLIVAFYGVFALALAAAGPTFFWGLLVVLVGQFLVALVLGEVASIYPLAGGIYQWTRQQTGATTGWFSAWAYWWTMVFTMTSCAYAAASFLLPGLGVTDASKATYIGVAAVIALIGLAINSIAQAILKIFVSLLLIAELTTTVILAFAFFFFYREHGFSTLLESFNTGPGGLNWLWMGWLGAVAIMGWTFLGFEAAGSIAEEVHDPARNVPKAIVGVMASIGVITVFVTMASILAIPDIPAAMTGNIADPVIQTATFHFGSGIEKPILVLISMGFIGSMVALHTAGSRALYSLARDKMIPGGHPFTKLTSTRKLPVNALAFTTLISLLILLINIGAEKVFTTLLTISVAGFFISYAFPILSRFTVHRRGHAPAGPFSLGGWSKPVTAIASVWIVFELINVWWPRYPDLPWYQNWGVLAVTILLTVLGLVAYALAPRHEAEPDASTQAQVADGPADRAGGAGTES